MREFIVEVPAFIRVTVDAQGPVDAGLVAGKIVDRLTFGESLERVGGVWQLVHPEIMPVDADEARPDVYVCSRGKLTYVDEEGWLEPTADDCGP